MLDRRNPEELVSAALARFGSAIGVSVVVVHGKDTSHAHSVVRTAMAAAELPSGTEVVTVACAAESGTSLALAGTVSTVAARRRGDQRATGASEVLPCEVDTFRDLAGPVLALVADAPTVLVITDAQWADDASLGWLAYLLRRTAHRRICLLLVLRGEPGAAVSALVGSVLGHGIGTATAVSVSDGDSADTPDQPHPGEQTDPALTTDRVTRVLRAAAVLRTTDVDLVAALARVPREDAEATLLDHGGLAAGGVPVTVLADVDVAETRWLRQEAARLLNDAGLAAEQVARHLLELPELREVWMRTALSDAAAEATRRGAPETAVRYLAAMLESSLLDGGDIHLRLGELLTDTDPRRAVDHLRVALVETTDLRKQARVAIRFALGTLAARRSAEAVAILEPILARLAVELGPFPAPEDHELLQCARSAFLIVCFDSVGTVNRAAAFLETVSEPVARTDADRQLLAMMSVADAFAGAVPARAADRAERALLLDQDDMGGWAALASAFVLGLTGENERALAALDAMVVRSSAAGRTWIRCLTLGTRSALSVAAGAFSAAGVDASLALAIARRESWHLDLVMPTVGFATALTFQGRAAEAERMLAGLSGAGDRLENSVLEKHLYLMARAAARVHLGDPRGALAHLRACGRSLAEAGVRNPLFTPWWSEAALLLAEVGDRSAATSLVEYGDDLVRSWDVPRARGVLLLARAAVTTPAGRVELLEEAVTLLDSPGSRYDQHRAHRALGVVLARLGDHRAARGQLRRATTLALQCGAAPAAAACRELLRRAGGRAAQVEVSGCALTAGERRIAELAAAGDTNREIAASLYLSTRTVELHLTNVYRKLGVTGRSGLAAALRDGGVGMGAAS